MAHPSGAVSPGGDMLTAPTPTSERTWLHLCVFDVHKRATGDTHRHAGARITPSVRFAGLEADVAARRQLPVCAPNGSIPPNDRFLGKTGPKRLIHVIAPFAFSSDCWKVGVLREARREGGQVDEIDLGRAPYLRG